MGRGIMRILAIAALNRLQEVLKTSRDELCMCLDTAQKQVVGLQAVRPLDADAVHLEPVEIGRDLCAHPLGEAVLELEDIGNRLIELRDPERRAELRVGQLHGQTDSDHPQPGNCPREHSEPPARRRSRAGGEPDSRNASVDSRETTNRFGTRDHFDKILDDALGDE